MMTRDEILHRALDMLDSASLDAKDRPGGVIQQDALCVHWLQDALNYFHRKLPWGGTIASASIAMSSATASTPADYILDVRNGICITTAGKERRLLRKPLQWWLSARLGLASAGTPRYYTIQGTTVRYLPAPDQSYAAELWYYQLPAALTASQSPNFPDDHILAEYVRLRGTEWANTAPPGSALAYADAIVAGLRKSGLGQEAEEDQFPLDPDSFNPTGATGASTYGWMGDAVPR